MDPEADGSLPSGGVRFSECLAPDVTASPGVLDVVARANWYALHRPVRPKLERGGDPAPESSAAYSPLLPAAASRRSSPQNSWSPATAVGTPTTPSAIASSLRARNESLIAGVDVA